MNEQKELETGLPQENAVAGQVGIDSYRDVRPVGFWELPRSSPHPPAGAGTRSRPRAGQVGTGRGILWHSCQFFIDLFQ
jgi:hypothetical protein